MTGDDMTGDEKVREIAAAAAGRTVRREKPAADRRRRLAWIAGVLLGLFLVGGTIYFVVRLVALQDQADANARAAQLLGEQVEQLGGTPVVQPPAVNDPDPDDPELQDGEVQDPEIQDGETQDPETQDPERSDAEVQDPELQESEVDDVERDDPDPDDPEQQDPEVQDPEVDDPPATGQPGPPPAGWTWTDPAGREQSCTRTGGPDSAPTYTCTAAPPPEPNLGPLLPLPGG